MVKSFDLPGTEDIPFVQTWGPVYVAVIMILTALGVALSTLHIISVFKVTIITELLRVIGVIFILSGLYMWYAAVFRAKIDYGQSSGDDRRLCMCAQSDLFGVPDRLHRGAYDLREFISVCPSTCVKDGAEYECGGDCRTCRVWQPKQVCHHIPRTNGNVVGGIPDGKKFKAIKAARNCS